MNKILVALIYGALASAISACSQNELGSSDVSSKRLAEAARAASVAEKLTKVAAEAAKDSAELAKLAKDNPNDDEMQANAEAAAEEAEALISKAQDGATEATAAKINAVQTAKDSQWQGFGFGVGASLTWDLGSDDRVGSVSVDANNIVRVDDEDNAIARIVLETHYFGNCVTYTPDFAPDFLEKWLGDGGCGIGPFVAIQPGENDIIDAIGFGLMVGFQRPKQPANDNTSFNIGIGAIVDPNATVLGAGISENEELPTGETSVRTREEAQVGILMLTSFAFN